MAGAPAVRRVDPADRSVTAAFATLRRASVEEREGPVEDPAFETALAEWWSREAPHRLAWLAELDGVAIGMVNALEFTRMPTPGRPAGRWGYLGNAYVRPEHRDRGVGALMVSALIEEGRSRGWVRIVLSPTERSVPFYRRAGFRDADELLVLTLGS